MLALLLPTIGCSQPSSQNGAAVRLSNVWALKVGALKGDTFGEDSWIATTVAQQNDPHEVLLARFLATRLFPEALRTDLSQLGQLPNVWGKRRGVKIAVDGALREAGVFSDLTMVRLSAESHVLDLEKATLTVLLAKGNPAALDIPPGLAQDLVKLEVLLNRALTPALAKEMAVTEADIWGNTSEDTHLAVEKFGRSLPASLSADQGAAAFVAKFGRLLQEAANTELRESRTRVRAIFEGTLNANPDLARTLGSTRSSVKKP